MDKSDRRVTLRRRGLTVYDGDTAKQEPPRAITPASRRFSRWHLMALLFVVVYLVRLVLNHLDNVTGTREHQPFAAPASSSSNSVQSSSFVDAIVAPAGVNETHAMAPAVTGRSHGNDTHDQHHTISSNGVRTDNNQHEVANDVSKNEGYYNANYWKFQEAYNKFGASYNGDMIRFVLRAYPGNLDSILEFGSSGGFILDSMKSIAGDSGIQLMSKSLPDDLLQAQGRP